jgi:translation initiation factor 5A
MADKPEQIKNLKPGSYITIDGEPCKVVGVTKSKPGKHGSTKVRLEAMGIFDNKRRFVLKPSTATVGVPIIEKKKAQVVNIDGQIAQLMDLETYETFEATIPEEFKSKLEPGTEVGYWKIGSRILIKEKRS